MEAKLEPTVSVVGRADQVGLLAEGELRDTLVPTLDDAANTDLGDERRSTVAGRVELGSVLEGSDVCRQASRRGEGGEAYSAWRRCRWG